MVPIFTKHIVSSTYRFQKLKYPPKTGTMVLFIETEINIFCTEYKHFFNLLFSNICRNLMFFKNYFQN